MITLKKNQPNIVRLIKRYNMYMIAVLLFFVSSCSKNGEIENQNIYAKKYIGQIELTDEEIFALSYATPHEISEEKALVIAKDFHSKFTRSTQTKSNSLISYSVLKKTLINERGDLMTSYPTSTKSTFHNSTTIYNVLINSSGKQSIAYVSADERMPDVIAIVPTRGGLTLNEYSIDPMLLLAQKTLAENISDLNSLIDSINRPTIKKLEAKFGPLPKTDLYNVLKENIKSKTGSPIKTKSEVQGYISNILSQVGPFVNSYWHQNYPFNDQMDTSATCSDGKYPAGCMVVAASQILGYYQPNMTIKVNEVPTPLQWTSFMSNPNGTDIYGNEYNYDAAAKSQITGLIKAVYDGTNSSPDCSGSLTYSQNAINYLKNYFNLDNTNHAPGVNMNIIKNSLDQLKLVLATGSRIPEGSSTKTGHAWVIDGYAVTRLNPGQNIVGNNVWQRYNMYLHANMGWGMPNMFFLNGSGWYLVGKDNNGTLTFKSNSVQEWSLNLTFYPNIVKK